MKKVLWKFKEQCGALSENFIGEVIQEVGLERGVDEEKAEGHSVCRGNYLYRNMKKHGILGDWQEACGGSGEK